MASSEDQVIYISGAIIGTVSTVLVGLWGIGKWIKHKGANEQNEEDRITFLEKQAQTIIERLDRLDNETKEGIKDLAEKTAKVAQEMAYISGQLKGMSDNHNHS